MAEQQQADVIIVGGSYAGLSAAMALGRSMRKVVILDGGEPCNRQTPRSHNFITHDGEDPAIINKKALQQVLAYDTVAYMNDPAGAAEKTEKGFSVTTKAGRVLSAKKLVLAMGVRDIFPDIEGFSNCWGISVIHCAYCDGYEFKGQKTGIMNNGKLGFHIAGLVNNFTDDITMLTNGPADFDEKQQQALARHSIGIEEREVVKIEHDKGCIQAVILADGTKMPLTALYATIPFELPNNIPASLRCEITEHGIIHTDIFQKTTVDGVYACGDNSSMLRSVAHAVSAGNIVGISLNNELTEEEF